MECTIDWMAANGMAFSAETGSGHLLVMDGAADGGGRNLAPRPMETVLAGTGACTAYDVVLILKRGRHDVRGCRVKVEAQRAETDPKVFTSDPAALHRHAASALPADAVERAIALSHDKYCSATIMLAKTASHHDELRARRRSPAASDVVGGRRHHAGRGAHRPANRPAAARRAPACSAAMAWPASSVFICSTMARDARSAAGRRARWLVEMSLDLALGLDDEAEAGRVAGAARDAGRCRTRRAYQSGLSRLLSRAELGAVDRTVQAR